MEDSDEIRRLIALREIEQLLAAYARATDWMDIEGLRDCFTPEAVVRFGPNSLKIAEFCEFWREMGGSFKARHHVIGIPVIAFAGENEAYVESPAVIAGTRADAGARMRDFMECNRYCFSAVRRDGRWLFDDLLIFITWSQGGPTSQGMESGGPLDHDVVKDHPAFRKIG